MITLFSMLIISMNLACASIPYIGKVSEISGKVLRINQKENLREKLETGMPILKGDTFVLGKMGYLKMMIENNIIIHLGANTVFSIEKLTAEKGEYTLFQGEFRASYNRSSKRIHEITTPLVFIDIWDAEILISSTDKEVDLLCVSGLARLHIENQKNIPLRTGEYMSTYSKQLDLNIERDHEYTLYDKKTIEQNEFNDYRLGQSETGRFIRLKTDATQGKGNLLLQNILNKHTFSERYWASSALFSSQRAPEEVDENTIFNNQMMELFYFKKQLSSH